jgi:hypothetical protein
VTAAMRRLYEPQTGEGAGEPRASGGCLKEWMLRVPRIPSDGDLGIL